MLLFEKNFTRFVPKTRDRPCFSSPVYRFSSSVRGTTVERVYQVRASTVPMPAITRAPTVSVSSTPEISSSPASTEEPGSTHFTPSRACTSSTRPPRRATTLAGSRSFTGSGTSSRSRTST